MKAVLVSLSFLFSILTSINAQYCNTITSSDAITPSTSLQYSTTYNSGRRVFTFNAVSGNEYTFSTVGQTTSDTYLRLYDSGTGGNILAENDDYSNTQSEITWYCSTSGTYSVLLTRWSASSTCANLNSNARIKYQMGSTSGSTIVSIGNGDGVVYVAPAYHYYKNNWTQMIYLKSEINTVGNINKIRFQVDPTSPSSYTATNQKIYMAHTTLSSFPNSAVKENAQTNYSSSNYMLVYSGSITWTIGWVEITLDTPFPWNNTDNLLIKYENRSGSMSSSYPGFYYTTKTSTVGYAYQDASYPTSDGARDGFRPNIKLSIVDNVALPIELTNFYGFNIGTSNILIWETASENNTSHYNIMRSEDGESWINVGSIGAAGNSTKKIEYKYSDYKYNNIINYYYISQYDNNGTYENYGPIAIDNRIEYKKIIKIINLAGQEVGENYEGFIIKIYEDGTMVRTIR